MIDDPEMAEIDTLFIDLGQLEVTPPNWSAVVDRIVGAPVVRPRRVLGLGWSAIVVGAIVALAVGVAGAVSQPVREAVFEPVANLLPWVNEATELPPGDRAPVGVDEERSPSDDERPRVVDEPAPIDEVDREVVERTVDGIEGDQPERDIGTRDSVTIAPPVRDDPESPIRTDELSREEILRRERRERLPADDVFRTTTTSTTTTTSVPSTDRDGR